MRGTEEREPDITGIPTGHLVPTRAMTPREAARKGLHVALGLFVFLVEPLGPLVLAGLFALAAAANATLLPRLPFTRWLLREEKACGAMAGLVLYPVVVALLLLLFHRDPRPAIAGWLALAVGDGLAPFLALLCRGPRWPWAEDKRVVPSLLAAALAGLSMLLWLPPVVAIAAATAGMLGETSPRFDDNLTCPVAAALAAGGVLSLPGIG